MPWCWNNETVHRCGSTKRPSGNRFVHPGSAFHHGDLSGLYRFILFCFLFLARYCSSQKKHPSKKDAVWLPPKAAKKPFFRSMWCGSGTPSITKKSETCPRPWRPRDYGDSVKITLPTWGKDLGWITKWSQTWQTCIEMTWSWMIQSNFPERSLPKPSQQVIMNCQACVCMRESPRGADVSTLNSAESQHPPIILLLM